MIETLTYSTTLTTISCGVCAIPFAIPTSLYDTVTADGRVFYCPNGHNISYSESEVAKLRKLLEVEARRATSRLAEIDRQRAEIAHQEARVRGYKGALVKSKKRAAKGVCPVAGCKRHFADVERHIASKHPEFATSVPVLSPEETQP